MTGARVGLVVPTIGRDAGVRALLASAAAGRLRPSQVIVANQSGRDLELGDGHPFPVDVIASGGGASAGRNDGCRALDRSIEVAAFPNDDCRLDEDTLADAVEAFRDMGQPTAIAGSLWEGGVLRFRLPSDGTPLDRRTVWRAIEATTFFRVGAIAGRRPFDERLGTGSPTPWQSGEMTDLLLRLLSDGHRVVSAPSVCVHGPGERRALEEAAYLRKVRAYARGTGYVFRVHDYRRVQKARLVVAPWARMVQARRLTPFAARYALQRSVGRCEGLLGRAPASVEWPRAGGISR